MPLHVVDGATLKCSLGSAPSKLKVVRPGLLIMNKLEANIMDSKPNTNIMPFGNCKCSSCKNKACVPATSGPWIQVIPSVKGRFGVSLLQPATIKCSHGGVITIVNPGQQKQTANAPKKSDLNIKTETEQQLFDVDTGNMRVKGVLKGELSSNPLANQSLNLNSMEMSMSQQLNGATLNLNSAGVPEISLANGTGIPVQMPSLAPATNGMGVQATFPLGEVGLPNGASMNTSMVVTATLKPPAISMVPSPVPIPVTVFTPAQTAVLAKTGIGFAAGVGHAFFNDLVPAFVMP